MNPRRLKREFGKDIIFHGGINTQNTMPFMKPDDVRKEVRELFSIFSDGGLILASDHCLLEHFPDENMFAMFDEALKCNY